MDPNNNQDNQNQNSQPVQPQNGHVSVNPGGKEDTPVSINSEQNTLDKFATHKPPEVSPEVERAGVESTMPQASVQKTVSGVLSSVMPKDHSHITKKDVQSVHKVEATGDVRAASTWIAALLEFIKKKILRKEASQKITQNA